MSFVTCKQFKDSQDAQDKALDTAKTEQEKALNNAKEQIAQSAMKAEAALLDCADNANGVTTSPTCLQNGKGGVISVAKIKQSIAGDVAVAVKPNSGITGDGTKNQPLGLNLSNDLTINTEGKLALNVVGPQVLANGNSLKTSLGMWIIKQDKVCSAYQKILAPKKRTLQWQLLGMNMSILKCMISTVTTSPQIVSLISGWLMAMILGISPTITV